MYDITRTALNRAWRTGFGTIVRREDGPFVEHYPEAPHRRHRNGLSWLLSVGRRRGGRQ
jgi:hypothetical protein